MILTQKTSLYGFMIAHWSIIVMTTDNLDFLLLTEEATPSSLEIFIMRRQISNTSKQTNHIAYLIDLENNNKHGQTSHILQFFSSILVDIGC